jgi:hypothetical protein
MSLHGVTRTCGVACLRSEMLETLKLIVGGMQGGERKPPFRLQPALLASWPLEVS